MTPKVIGVTRVRNEAHIISAVLDHVARLVDEVVVYDDASTDDTPDICEAHPIVSRVMRGKVWDPTPRGRFMAEGYFRQEPYRQAVRRGADWVYYFDGDEFLELDDLRVAGVVVPRPANLAGLISLMPTVNAFLFRLLDAYITPEDVLEPWTSRRWFGPEYRDILMLFKVNDGIQFTVREPAMLGAPWVATFGGWVRHYGKAISVEHWEETCEYYVKNRGGDLLPQFSVKWEARRGKAIHRGVSDFGGKLIRWEEREKLSVPLVDDPNQYASGTLEAPTEPARVFKYGET